MEAPAAYKPFVEEVMGGLHGRCDKEPTRSEDVVKAIWQAVTDPSCPAHLPAGSDAEALAA